MFCDNCGSILSPVKKEDGSIVMNCQVCGEIGGPLKEGEAIESQKVRHREEKELTVILDNQEENRPTLTVPCSSCGNDKATFWQVQTRGGDEQMTVFYRCTKCGKTWRD